MRQNAVDAEVSRLLSYSCVKCSFYNKGSRTMDIKQSCGGKKVPPNAAPFKKIVKFQTSQVSLVPKASQYSRLECALSSAKAEKNRGRDGVPQPTSEGEGVKILVKS